MFYPIAMFGPTYVGKTTFGRFLAENGPFTRLPIVTSRPPRMVENDPDLSFATEQTLCDLTAHSDWIVNKIGANYYAMNLAECRMLLAHTHVIVGVTTGTKDAVKERIPDLFSLLLWPEDFEALQKALADTGERPAHERKARLKMNANDASLDLEADLKLIIKRCAGMQKRLQHFTQLQETLLATLKTHHPNKP